MQRGAPDVLTRRCGGPHNDTMAHPCCIGCGGVLPWFMQLGEGHHPVRGFQIFYPTFLRDFLASFPLLFHREYISYSATVVFLFSGCSWTKCSTCRNGTSCFYFFAPTFPKRKIDFLASHPWRQGMFFLVWNYTLLPYRVLSPPLKLR
jgi:hypothetical protein